MFLDDFAFKNTHQEGQNFECKFEFGPQLIKDSRDFIEDPFNFALEFSSPEDVRSYQNELNFEFDLSASPKYYTCDLKKDSLKKNEGDKYIHLDANKAQNSQQITKFEEIKQLPEKKVDVQLISYDKSSSYSSQASCDSIRLEKLIKYLSKSKGVNSNKIDGSIVARTIEFGQQKIADELNIPYRRYKSILNKVGIKTNAGRKVKNLQLESELVDWATKIKESNHLLTRKMIREKASRIIKELVEAGDASLKKIRLSKGWLDKFVRRHQVISDYITSQKGKKGQ